MQNYSSKDTRRVGAFVTKIEDIPGGGVVAVADLTQKSVEEGTPVGIDSNGLYHVTKLAILSDDAANDATDYYVDKGHNFKVGDILAAEVGKKAYPITNIDASDVDKDKLTVATTLGVAFTAGAIVFQALAQSATTTSALKFNPVGLVGTGFDIVENDNHTSDIVVRGTIKKEVAPILGSLVEAALPLIRIV